MPLRRAERATRRPRRHERPTQRRTAQSGPWRVLGLQDASLGQSTQAKSCSLDVPRERATSAQGSRLRLTNRGVALVLIAGALIVLAAVAVIGLTAARVTADSYQPSSSSAGRP